MHVYIFKRLTVLPIAMLKVATYYVTTMSLEIEKFPSLYTWRMQNLNGKILMVED